MYARILVPMDGSHFSEEVLPYALSLAQATNAKLALMRVAERDAEQDEASRQLQALAQRLQAQAVTVPSRVDVATTILAEANREPGTLVAMTSHGRSGIAEAMLGSVAREVVRTGHAPVLVYRPDGRGAKDGQTAAKINTVMLPLDGSSHSESIEQQAGEWAKALGARLLVAQVIAPNAHSSAQVPVNDTLESSYVRADAIELGRKHGVEANWEVLHGNPVDAMVRFIGSRRDILVVMATRMRGGLQGALLGSVTAGLLRSGGVPIIVSHP